MEKNKTELTLKWGTLKEWCFTSKRGKKLLKEYSEISFSSGAAQQRDTPRQKEIICELIDLCEDGTVFLDWDGKFVSNEEAKKYVMNYGKE